jgi:hypothetical protein
MISPLAAHFEALRRRFPAAAGLPITNTQQSFEMMEFTALGRPPESRCAYFEIGIVKFLVWEMDQEADSFQVFATTYMISLGILKLSSKPSGIVTIAGFAIDLAALAGVIAAHFQAPKPAENFSLSKPKVLLFGFCESFGHHFWNEVSGLTIAKATGLFDGLDGIIVGPFDYFNLGPALQAEGKQIWKFNSVGSIILPEQLMIYSSHVVTEEARRLVLDHAAADAISPEPQHNRPSICFQIRRHRRPWINEEKGLYEMILACARAWPDMIFIIDGHSTSKGVLSVKQGEIAEEARFVSRLAVRLGDGIDLRATIGMDVNEKINILKHVDLFVGPIGSGGVLSSWLLRKPSIAYGPISFYDMVRHQDGIVPEGGATTLTVPRAHITDRQDSALSFDVDVDAILYLIRQTMEKMTPAAANPLIKIA